MDASVMVGRGTGGVSVFLLNAIIVLTVRGTHAQTGDGCGHSVLGVDSGSVASLGYPLSYPNHSVCVWEISISVGHTLLLRIADLDINTQNCQLSYLRLYNGIGPDRTEMVKLCGGAQLEDNVFQSAGHQVTVQFMSGPHAKVRGFFLSYATNQHPDLISCLERGDQFTEAEFSKFCPAGCLTEFGEVSGTVPHGYRDSSVLCLAGIHAGVVSNMLGGQVSVISSTGIPHYDSTTANNVTSVLGGLSPGLFTFKTSGCYGMLGLESGVVSSSQISASSVWEWSHDNSLANQDTVWGPSGARLKKAGLPWVAAISNQHQWIQVDFIKEKRITGIITTGSTLSQYQFYVSAYRILYSRDGQKWTGFREAGSNQDKIFQGNTNYFQEVRNNFIPPIDARYIRISPTQWHQRIALKMELLGCQPHIARPRIFHYAPPALPPRKHSTKPPLPECVTHTPNIRNTTVPSHGRTEVALVAVLVPVLVMVLTAPILVMVCAWLWRHRKNTEVTYDLPHWERTVWWKSMKQLLPSKLPEGEECVRYSSPARDHHRLHSEPAEYAQPLVNSTLTSLGQRSTFKPKDGADAEYDTPLTPDLYHAYAEPLPATGAEYATPIMIDRVKHQSGGTLLFIERDRLAQTENEQTAYDTPKSTPDLVTPSDGLVYQVPQNTHNAPSHGTN
ncbi:discoidin, CUB and LCCL domain-containing protein 2 [Chanos chanos]|uniref:Discoidin, CUB and LCCL domain-containing protein 2 n=1 Tax=Chanos chanos TaxID=29144 RepID=A0A6J2WD99_CHACN|nr:discoidin, CUB and LCCL domain-containing protein 2 [Chanos chanos]